MAALKAAGELLHEHKAWFVGKCAGFNEPGRFGPAELDEFQAAGFKSQAAAERCEGAIADLERALDEAAAAPRARSTAASPSALFKAGFEAGTLAYAWSLANDDERPRPKIEDFGGRMVAPDWAAAWAVVRAQLAGGA
jgi:hypothetical protein